MNDISFENLNPAETLTLRHEFAGASAADLYAAFTDPATFIKWFGPKDWKIVPSTLTLEPVTGGRKQFIMKHSVNPKYQAPMYMRFVAMKEPSLLEYREALPTPTGQPSETLVALRIEFEEGTAITADGVGSGTSVKLTTGPLPAAVHEQTAESWKESFNKLEKLLG
ncbi:MULTISPECIES: SRPBCC domain-containing protein [unclassified Rothia (in: high G+C Gram-positive bacteria)]|uniref:SRPBCC family protein n=1 Tax=unclassified Rothia (in: high G+C Gram-positive bacteria) TaxID=2689056 RepID=UPI00195A3F77|nr:MULTISPECIES: SRPBCC domain-containing protein [unclassified Rothia (in: high G+C Gram-positive bacteria)]MBM7052192.1 SRPBCC domain-containing protein [Rothia sp. ZJ1223]QRZ61366.1 SRPBCC domain-containing protein [Rothia sp. ZJ932]